MTEVDGTMIMTVMQRIQADMAEMRRDMTTMTLRQTATEHFEQGLMAHVASIHGSIDDLKSDVRMIKRRLDLVDAE